MHQPNTKNLTGTRYIDGTQYVPNSVNEVYYHDGSSSCFFLWWYAIFSPYIALFAQCEDTNRFVCQYYGPPPGVSMSSHEITQQNQVAK